VTAALPVRGLDPVRLAARVSEPEVAGRWARIVAGRLARPETTPTRSFTLRLAELGGREFPSWSAETYPLSVELGISVGPRSGTSPTTWGAGLGTRLLVLHPSESKFHASVEPQGCVRKRRLMGGSLFSESISLGRRVGVV